MIRTSILFILIGGLVQWSFSQSEFLLRGESGCGGGLGLSTNREGNGLNISAGYSYRGFIDASLIVRKGKRRQCPRRSFLAEYYLLSCQARRCREYTDT